MMPSGMTLKTKNGNALSAMEGGLMAWNGNFISKR
jgi:hypothetical protein